MEEKRIINKRNVFILILLLIIIYYAPSLLAGYYWTESSAMKNSFPNVEGKIIYEKEFDNKKIVVLDTDHTKIINIIENNFWFLHRSMMVAWLYDYKLDEKMNAHWSAKQKEGDFYDTLFATEVHDKNIVKIIVSNERNLEGKEFSLEEVKEQSPIFIEMEVIDGIAVHYQLIDHSEGGNFIFRGVDEEGNVLSIY